MCGHDSVEDARAALKLYRHFQKIWEDDLKNTNYCILQEKYIDDTHIFKC